jgi:hypothetical protein
MSNASIYEEMAVHYSRELADQLLRFNPLFADIVSDARTITGNSSLDLADIVNDSGFQARLEEHFTEPETVSLQYSGTKLPVRLVVSPLDNAFQRRRITLTSLDTSSNLSLNSTKYYKATIDIAWVDKNSGRSEPRETKMVIFLREG